MSEQSQIHFSLFPVAGVRLGTTCAGIKKPGRRDLVLIELAEDSEVTGMFTTNAFCAAPVTIAKKHLQAAKPQYLLINTGNANAGTGEQGYHDAMQCCQAVADMTGCTPEQVLPFSTGVIGEPLPVSKITAGLDDAYHRLDESGWEDAAHGIMTTDTVAKAVTRRLSIHGKEVVVSGMAKGSGMIRPDMATMLAYVMTDAKINNDLLRQCLQQAVNASFNRITVDGDTSTNDAVILAATGQSGVELSAPGKDFDDFSRAVQQVCEELAMAIVRDGEGATKLITIDVQSAADETEANQVAFTIAHSPLVKTAFFASDPNWGRILAAVGRAGLKNLDLEKIEIYLGDVCIVRDGGRATGYTEEQGQRVMDQSEITIGVLLGRGNASTRVWTCDFSYDYVRINAEYRT